MKGEKSSNLHQPWFGLGCVTFLELLLEFMQVMDFLTGAGGLGEIIECLHIV